MLNKVLPYNYRNTKQAYDTWEMETARCFRIPAGENVDPLIVVTGVLPRPLLEELSVAIPSPNRIVAIGPSAQILDPASPTFLSRINVTCIALKWKR